MHYQATGESPALPWLWWEKQELTQCTLDNTRKQDHKQERKQEYIHDRKQERKEEIKQDHTPERKQDHTHDRKQDRTPECKPEYNHDRKQDRTPEGKQDHKQECKQEYKHGHKHQHGLLLTLVLLSLLFSAGECYIRDSEGEGGSRMAVHHHHHHHHTTPPPPPPPQLDPSHSTDVTALSGKTAVLNCRVHNVNNKTVSWIRHRDIHLLTVGRYTYTSDQRFRAKHKEDTDDWILTVNYVQTRDSGMYECQISTTPPTSHFIRLTVVKPLTYILGGPDMHINKGSTINLTCVVEYSPEPPDFIFWYHNNKIISYDSERGGVTVIIEKGDLTTSFLLIQRAQPSDSGRYDCSPANTSPANVTVHVLNGEHPAAMQHGGQGTYTSSSFRNILSLLALLVFPYALFQ